jgi:hypothetical protein
MADEEKLGAPIVVTLDDGNLTKTDSDYSTKGTDKVIEVTAPLQVKLDEDPQVDGRYRIFASGGPASIVGGTRTLLGGTFLLADQKSVDVRLDTFGNWVPDSSAQPFTFDMIPGLVLDLFADDGYGPTRWVDRTPYGNSLANASTGIGDAADGHTSVRFDGATSFAICKTFVLDSLNDELEVAVVAKLMGASNGGRLWSYQDETGNEAHDLRCDSGSNMVATSGASTVKVPVDAGTWSRFHVAKYPASIELFVNGASTGTAADSLTTVAKVGHFVVGASVADGDGKDFGRYDVARVLVWNRKLSASIRLFVDSMLAALYPST